MKRWTGAVIVLVALAWSVTAAGPRVSRENIAALEKKFDQQIESFSIDDPFLLLGNTRGVYLDDYGAVFTAELNLVAAAVVTPFRPSFTNEQIEKIRQKKLQRIATLKSLILNMVMDSASTLKQVPPEEQIVVGVSLFYYSWENTDGLPSQILMQASRQSLLAAGSSMDSVIRVQEF